MKEKEISIDIELPSELAGGNYSNLVMIAHSPTEFVVDFAQMLPGLPKPKISNRVILTPQHAKRLLYALKDNVDKYESVNGDIVEPVMEKTTTIPYNIASMGEA